MPRFVWIVPLLLLSAAHAGDEIKVDRTADAVIVRSPTAQGNFLFRAPLSFTEADTPPEGCAVQLDASEDGRHARIRLRIVELRADELRRGLRELTQAREDVKAGLSGEGAGSAKTGEDRVFLKAEGQRDGIKVARTLVCLRDGTRLYLLYLDEWPGSGSFAAALETVGTGFTILDPKGGGPAVEAPTPEDLKPETLEHDYYRLKVFKPEGFAQVVVDPNEDKGIVFHLRRYDDKKNLCDVYIRVFLKKAIKWSLPDRAQKRIDAFAKKYPTAKVPRKAQRARWSGAKEAFKCKLVGKAKAGTVIEEWRFIEHENGRVYEIQMRLWGGAAREWRKDIATFWKKLKMRK